MKYVKGINLMHMKFGKTNGKCKSCNNLVKKHIGSKNVYKCKIYGDTNSNASDWHIGYQACKMNNKEYNGIPIINNKKKQEKQIEGQESLFPLN